MLSTNLDIVNMICPTYFQVLDSRVGEMFSEALFQVDMFKGSRTFDSCWNKHLL